MTPVSLIPFVFSALVSILMNVTRIGATTVYLLLSSNMVYMLTNKFIPLSMCQWIPIVSAVSLVPMWLGSPADFWQIAYSAMISTTVGTILLIINISIYVAEHGLSNRYPFQGMENFSSAFGTILFAFGGASSFPNFQNDMKEKSKFTIAVVIGFTG